MKNQFPNSFVYITPLTKPYLDCTKGVIKVKHAEPTKGLYEKLDFSELEKEGKK
ncbi:hypothetical protein [Intestinibacter sp.]|uniref:hypothetical protein n=1 Tax=Intestinibacter sp. TaxID=1965304 RepID=UPI00307F1F06